jgi:hypothetical protein
LLPWPNDFFTVADPSTDTGRRLNLKLLAMPRNVAGIPIDPTDITGVDPHGPDWSEQPDGYLAIAAFLSPLGRLPAVCGTAPCYLDGWAGP